MSEDNYKSSNKSINVKYKPSKKGKIALRVLVMVMTVDFLTFLTLLLNNLNNKLSFISEYGIIIAIICSMTGLLAYAVWFVDYMRFKQINNSR